MAKTDVKLKVGDQVHHLSEQGATIGRESDNTIVLDDESVSSHHAEFFIRDGVYCVRDLGSTNGSTLNGNAFTDSELKSGDIVLFGTIETTFLVIPQTQEASDSEERQSAYQTGAEGPNHSSMGDKIKQAGKAAWAETKRRSHLVSLKAQIEKLTRMDLRHAHQELGKACYESKIGEEKFAQQFQEIRSLQERIVDKRKSVHVEEGAKTVEKLKAAAQDQAGKIAAEALIMKYRKLLVKLGEASESQERYLMPKEILETIDRIKQQINSLQIERAKLTDPKLEAAVHEARFVVANPFIIATCASAFLCFIALIFIYRTHVASPDLFNAHTATSKSLSTIDPNLTQTNISDQKDDLLMEKVMSAQLNASLDKSNPKISWQIWEKNKSKVVSETSIPAGYSWGNESKKLIEAVDRYQSMYMEENIFVVSKQGNNLFEVKQASEQYGPTFLLETRRTQFASTGLAYGIPLKFVSKRKTRMKNGFDVEMDYYLEVVQDEVNPVREKLYEISKQCAIAVLHNVGTKKQWTDLYKDMNERTREGMISRNIPNKEGRCYYWNLWLNGYGDWCHLSNVIVHEVLKPTQ